MLTSELTHPAVHLGLNRVSRFDTKRDRLVSYRYPDEQIPEEHLFVPKPGSRPESEGWVIGTAHDWQRQETRLNVFEFAALDAGPIASAALPYLLPLGLHGKFAAG